MEGRKEGWKEGKEGSKKQEKKKKSISELGDNFKQDNIHLTGIPKVGSRT